jgi:ankyrin repeat protein
MDIFKAANQNTIKHIKTIIEEGADIESRNEKDETPLVIAARFNKIKVAEYLLDHGANPSIEALIKCARHGGFEIAELLLEKGLNINTFSHQAGKILKIAVNKSQYEMVRLLLENGADTTTPENTYKTPLVDAVERNNRRLVKILVEHGVNITRSCFVVCMHHTKNHKMIKYLIELGAKPKGVWSMIYCGTHDRDLTQLVLQAGDDINLNFDGKPKILDLRHATYADRDINNLVHFMMANSADINIIDPTYGDTALILAAGIRSADIIELLLHYGANINTQNNRGETALIIASRNNKLKNIRTLITHDAHMNIQDNEGNTALIEAVIQGNIQIFKLLKKCGADLTITNNAGKTALIEATERGFSEIQQLLA